MDINYGPNTKMEEDQDPLEFLQAKDCVGITVFINAHVDLPTPFCNTNSKNVDEPMLCVHLSPTLDSRVQSETI